MEWSVQDSWTLEDSIKLAKLLPQAGVDILDVSSGGNHPDQKIDIHPYYQVGLAHKIRQSIRADGLELLVAAVGLIDDAEMAQRIVQDDASKFRKIKHANQDTGVKQLLGPQADLVLVGRQFLRDTEFVFTAAKQLDIKVQWPLQYLPAQKSRK